MKYPVRPMKQNDGATDSYGMSIYAKKIHQKD